MRYLIRILIATNQLTNTLLGGDPQMSMSARAGFARNEHSKLGTFWCATFDLMDHHHLNSKYPVGADHCEIAVIDYRLRKTHVH